MTNNIQITSIAAYDKVISGLGNRQYEVMTILKEIEPACNKEIADKLCLPINEVTPRTVELRYKGVVEEAYKADYKGRKVIYWRTVDSRVKKILRENPIKEIFGEDPIEQFDELIASIRPKEQTQAVSWLDKGEKF